MLHDLRTGSPTDGATLAIDLGRQPDGTHSHRGVFIPPGVAHGFAALTDMTITYLVDGYYNPADELRRGLGRPGGRGRLGPHRPDPVRSATSRTPAGPTSTRSGSRTTACAPERGRRAAACGVVQRHRRRTA